MRIRGPIRVLDEREEEHIHATMVRIVDEVGLVVEHEGMLRRLAELGGRVDKHAMRVRFSPELVEGFIADSETFDRESVEPSVGGYAGVYQGYFLNPETEDYEPWTRPTLLRYLKVAHYLPHTSSGISIVFQPGGVPTQALVPFSHYLALKFFGRSAASVTDVRQCPCVLAMCEAAASEMGVDVDQVFRGCVYLISPLKLGRQEAEVFAFFAERGLRVGIGHMVSAGGTGPVTLAGSIALNLAQDVFTNIVRRAWFGDRDFAIGCSISPLDMRTGMYTYGRPEKELCNVAMAQMARRYGARYGGHCGLTDAKRPSVEAGFQKALGSIPTLMACGHAYISCGLLSVDEVFSPIQMILDDEVVSALQRFARGFEVNEETLAFDLIKQVGPGGGFLDAEHTARHYRGELWQPRLFAREMLAGWQRHGARTDVDIARDIYYDLVKREPIPARISPALERKLLDIVRAATGAEIQPVEPE